MKRSIIKILMAILAVAFIAVPAFTVPYPFAGMNTPDGRYIYIPDMNSNRIRVVDTTLISGTVDIGAGVHPAVIQNVPLDGDPYCMAVNNAGTLLFVTVHASTTFPYKSYIKAYSISSGTLAEIGSYQIPDDNSSPRGCVLSPSGNYLYVADYWPFTGGPRIRVINVSNPAAMTEGTPVSVAGTNMRIYGMAINPSGNGLYVTVNHSATGQVRVYDISTENAPIYVTNTGAGSCPQASYIKFSPDGTKYFVQVLQTVPPYADIKVYAAATNGLITDIVVPGPGNHEISADNNSDGYCDDTTDYDADTRNYDAGFAIRPGGNYLYFTHYRGRSGDGMWQYNVKLYTVDISNLPTYTIWERGGGFHSNDSLMLTSRYRMWLTYSDGGLAQAYPNGAPGAGEFLGPEWVDSYNETSNEAMIIWDNISISDGFQIQYNILGDPASTAILDVSGVPTSEYKLPGLTQMTNYEIRVRLKSGGLLSEWSPSIYVNPQRLYTLEQVWVSHYNTSTSEATIIYGPLISQTVKEVPFAARYDLQYRISGSPSWTTVSVPWNSKGDPTNDTNPTYKLTGLAAYATYEARMRSVDSTGGVSKWSAIDTFMTVPTPWINAFNPGPYYAWIEWGSIGGAKNIPGVTTYEMQYKRKIDVPWTAYTSKVLTIETQEDSNNSNLNIFFTGNTATLGNFTTYEVRVRGVYPDSSTTVWSNIDEFFTWGSMPNGPYQRPPTWVSHYNVTSNDAVVNCENVDLSPGFLYQYQFRYRIVGTSTWSQTPLFLNSARYNTGDNNPNYHLTGLAAGSTYEVQAQVFDGTNYSTWVGYDTFYTLERPWVDWYPNTTGTRVYITWGPELSPGVYVPNATSYDYRYRINGSGWTTVEGIARDCREDLNNNQPTDNLNFLYPFTTVGSHEVQMRSRYTPGAASDWSTSATFTISPGPLIYRPWIGHYNVTTNEAVIQWNWIAPPGNPGGVATYEMYYSTNEGTTWSLYSGQALNNSTRTYDPASPNMNFKWTGLTPLTTYEVRIRAINASGQQVGNWSSIDTFHTFYQLWLEDYHTQATSAIIQWGPMVPTAELGQYEMEYKRAIDAIFTPFGTYNNSTPVATTELPNLNILLSPPLTPATTYEVRMRAVSSGGFAGDWTSHSFITIRGPWWIDVTVISPTLAHIFWENTPGAIGYELLYSTAPSAEGNPIIPIAAGITSSDAMAPAIQPNTTYYTKVRAITPSGRSDWTNIKSFITTPGPGWISNYLTTTTNTQFIWQAVPGVTSYEVSYGTAADATGYLWSPSNPTTNDSAASFNAPISAGISGRAWYYEKVRAYIGGSVSQWSPIDSFFTIPAPNNVQWMGSTVTTADISWEAVNMGGPLCASYEVSWGLTPEAVGFGKMTSEVYSTLSGLTTGQTYYVKVRARDDINSGYSDWAPYPALVVVATDEATISSVDIISGWRGTTVIISGANFGSTAGTITFGGTTAQPGYWKNNEIAVSVPPAAAAGPNAIVVTTFAGKVAAHVPAPYSFNVTDGGFVLDDIEGGCWNYATWESGGGNNITFGKNYTTPPERSTDLTVECQGTAVYEIVGSVSPYGDDIASELGYDLTPYKQISLRFKGDGSANQVYFELVESNQAAGNSSTVTKDAEVWKYNVPISLNNAGWQTITINLTTDGVASFEPVSDIYAYVGDGIFAQDKIKAFQFYSVGAGGTKNYAIDYVYATNEAGGVGTRIYDIRYIDELNSENWIAIPFGATGVTNSFALAQSIGQAPTMTPQEGDFMLITVRDNVGQTFNQGMAQYSSGAWMDLLQIPINTGDTVSVVISNSGRPQINGTWTISGNILPVGAGNKQYSIRYIDELNSENWIAILDSIFDAGVTNSFALAQSIGQAPTMTPQEGDFMLITVRDNASQTINQGMAQYSSGAWMDLLQIPISKDDFVSVAISNAGRPTNNGLWP